jgi:hypothetical protein
MISNMAVDTDVLAAGIPLNLTPQRAKPIARNTVSISLTRKPYGATPCCWRFQPRPRMSLGIWSSG